MNARDNTDTASLGDLMVGDLVVTATGAEDTGRRGDAESSDERRRIYRLSGVRYHVVGVRGSLVERGESLDVGIWMEGDEAVLAPEDLVGPLVVIRTRVEGGTAVAQGLSRVALTLEVAEQAVVIGGVSGDYGSELSRFLDHLVSVGMAGDRQAALSAWLEESASRATSPGPIGQAYGDFYWDERRGPPTTEDTHPKVPFLLVLDGFEGKAARAVSLTGQGSRDVFAMRVSAGSYGWFVSRAPGEQWKVAWTDNSGRDHSIGYVDPHAPGLEGGIRITVHWADPPTLEVEPTNAGEILDHGEPSEGTIVRDP